MLQPNKNKKIVSKQKPTTSEAFLADNFNLDIKAYKNIRKKYESTASNVTQLLDPSGVTGYPGVAFAAMDLIDKPNLENLGKLGLNTLGALPGLGKAKFAINLSKKAGKLTKTEKVFEKVGNVARQLNKPLEKLATSNIPVVNSVAKSITKADNAISKTITNAVKPKTLLAKNTKDLSKIQKYNIATDALDIANAGSDLYSVYKGVKDNKKSNTIIKKEIPVNNTDNNYSIDMDNKVNTNNKVTTTNKDIAMNTEKITPKDKNNTTKPNATKPLQLKAPIAKYQQGVQDGKSGKWGDRIYYKFPPTKPEDYENVETHHTDVVHRTPEYQNYMKKQKTPIKPVVKAALGAALSIGSAVAGPLITGIAGIINAKKQKKEAKKLQIANQTTNFNQAMIEQDMYSDQFDYSNMNDLPVYSKGGKMGKPMLKKGGVISPTSKLSTTGELDAVGGDLVPISNNAEIVVGNTHKEKKIDNSYGVTLSKNNEPIVNVENKEVIVDNNLVFSDKLKKGNETFAKVALKLNSKIGELENKGKKLIKPNQIFANNRTIEGLKNKNQMLFAEQDAMKKNKIGNKEETVNVSNGIVPMAANGTDVDSIEEPKMNLVANLAPLLIDNIANAFINKNTPKVPKPLLNRAPILDTRMNVNPQLAEINNSVTSSNKFIENNTNNSGVARANITANNLKSAELKSNVLAQKQQAERQGENQQKQIFANVSASNNALTDQYNQAVYDQKVQKNNNTSANITNAVEDFSAVKQNYLTRQSEDDTIDLSLSNDPTGEKSRSYLKVAKTMRPSTKALIKANMINSIGKGTKVNPFAENLNKQFNTTDNVFMKKR